MQANIQEEPLWGHHVYEKVLSLSKGPGPFRQVARNRETGELVAIKFVPRGWDNATAMGHARSLYNHMVSRPSSAMQSCSWPYSANAVELRAQLVCFMLPLLLRNSAWPTIHTSLR